MDIKQFENKSVAEIEAQIEKDVNIRDEMNADLLALNQLRDRKAKAIARDLAVAEFQDKHGFHPEQPPTQTVSAGSVSAGAKP